MSQIAAQMTSTTTAEIVITTEVKLRVKRHIAAVSGVSSIVMSRKASSIEAGPSTRKTEPCGANMARKAPAIPSAIVGSRRSNVSLTMGGISATASRRCVSRVLIAIVLAPTLSNILVASSFGSTPSGAAANTSAAVLAAASRSRSQFSRTVAMRGT
jgi:hypothetical protein